MNSSPNSSQISLEKPEVNLSGPSELSDFKENRVLFYISSRDRLIKGMWLSISQRICSPASIKGARGRGVSENVLKKSMVICWTGL